MKRHLPGAVLLIAAAYLSATGFQCGSAELTSAKLYIQQKQWQKAEESLQKQIVKNDKDPEAWFLLGQVRRETMDYAGMNDAYTRSLALSDVHKNEITHYRLLLWSNLYSEGASYIKRARDTAAYFDSALVRFKTGILLEPDSSETYYGSAIAYNAKQDYEGAGRDLQTALEKNPQFFDAARFLGQIQYAVAQNKLIAKDTAGATAEYAKAAESFKKAFDLQPDNPDNIAILIDAYERSHQTEKAEAITRDGVKRDPKNKIFRQAFGFYLLEKEDYAGAIEQFTKALEIDSSYSDASYNMGVAYLNWGVSLRTAAIKALESQKKGAKPVKEDVSYMEKFKLALPYLEQSVLTRPNESALWTRLGGLYAILNMQAKSKAAFEKADKLTKGK